MGHDKHSKFSDDIHWLEDMCVRDLEKLTLALAYVLALYALASVLMMIIWHIKVLI